MTKLSVNINKIALIRNARGHNNPNLIKTALDIERFGADGITVHPRPDERHIRYKDCYELKEVVTTELNIEGYPNERFIEMVKAVKPDQCTLVPDLPGALTSDTGWDTIKHSAFLTTIIKDLQDAGCRVSLFIDPVYERLEAAKAIGTDRIEFYTGPYADYFKQDKEKAILPYKKAAKHCLDLGLGINAGHDLDLNNLAYFKEQIDGLLEVSIGHALVCDALYLGLDNTVNMYKRLLLPKNQL